MPRGVPNTSTVRETLRIVKAAERLDSIPSGSEFVDAIVEIIEGAKALRSDQVDDVITYLHERFPDGVEAATSDDGDDEGDGLEDVRPAEWTAPPPRPIADSPQA